MGEPEKGAGIAGSICNGGNRKKDGVRKQDASILIEQAPSLPVIHSEKRKI